VRCLKDARRVATWRHSTEWLTFYELLVIFIHMVKDPVRLDLVFRALGDSTRRGMLERLARGEQTVGELAQPYQMSLASASKHIKTLERAGLVKRSIRGRTHFCLINPAPLAKADDWLRGYEQLWDTRLERLAALLRHPDHEAQTP
jgi:DNA-binding transcriptional ArsR family regulator